MTLLKVFDYIVNNLSYHDMSNFDYNYEIHVHEYDMLHIRIINTKYDFSVT